MPLQHGTVDMTRLLHVHNGRNLLEEDRPKVPTRTVRCLPLSLDFTPQQLQCRALAEQDDGVVRAGEPENSIPNSSCVMLCGAIF